MSMYEYIGEIPGKINDQNAERQSIVDLLGYDGAAVTGKHELNDGRIRPGFGLMVDDGSYYDVADIVRNIATLEKSCCLDTLTEADATTGVAPTDSVEGTPIKVKAESVHTQADAGTQTISAPKAITGNDTIIITNTNGVDTDTYTLTPAATLYGLSTATDHIQADTGVVTRQTKLVILDGTETWSGATTPYVLTLTDKAAGTTNFVCSHSITAASGTTQGTCVGHAVNTTVSFNAPTGAAYDTLTEWKAVLLAASTGANPVQLLYEIADTTENIGPTFVTALSGTNTITHDGGGAITINYYRDINDLTDTVDGLDVMTTRGDIIYQGAAAPARLAKGTAGYALVQGANDPAWAKGDSIIITDTNSKFTTDTIKGALDELSTYDVITTRGDIIAGGTSGAPTRVEAGTSGQVLCTQGTGNVPAWTTPGYLAIADTYSNFATDNLKTALDTLSPLLDDNLILTTATLPDTDAELFEGLKVYDTTTDQQLWCKVPGEQEDDTVTVTQGAITQSGNVTITLNGVAKTVAVAKEDTASGVATKLKAASYTGWTTGGSGAIVTFKKDAVGACSAPTAVDTGGTGVTFSAFTQTNVGVTTVWSKGPTVWTAWTPVLSWTGGPPTVTSTVARYVTSGNICFFNVYSVISDGGGATALTVPLPIAPVDNSSFVAVTALELVNATWSNPMAYIDEGATEVAFYGLSALTDDQACKIILSGQYEIA